MEKRKFGRFMSKPHLSEKTLSALFDYQRFEQNPLLGALIDETGSEYGAEISDDDISRVSAAGEARPAERRRDGEDGGAL